MVSTTFMEWVGDMITTPGLEKAIKAAFEELRRQDEDGKPGPFVGSFDDESTDIFVDGWVDMRALVLAALVGGGYIVVEDRA
jgi:hypothetical protein